MKKALLLIALAVCTLAAAQAGGIEGKWHCSKAMLDSLGLKKYPNIRGYYKFGKDGTFTVRIKGDRVLLRSSNSHGFAWKTPRYMRNRAKNQTVSIKVKGTYTTDGGTITTTVDPRDVYCYINTGLQNPTEPDASASWGEYYWAQHKINLYESVESTAERLANFIKTKNMHLWQWSGEPLAVTKDSLTVGAAMKFSRQKPERTYATGEGADPRPHPYCRIESEKADKAVAIVRKRKGTAKKKLWAIKALDEAVAKDSASWWLYHLGLAHLYGYGGKPDPAKATFFLEKAAQAGYGGKAYLALGMMYKDGKGGARQDFQKAYAYFCKGADDDRKCQYAKGSCSTRAWAASKTTKRPPGPWWARQTPSWGRHGTWWGCAAATATGWKKTRQRRPSASGGRQGCTAAKPRWSLPGHARRRSCTDATRQAGRTRTYPTACRTSPRQAAPASPPGPTGASS